MIIIGELINASRGTIGATIEAQGADAIGQGCLLHALRGSVSSRSA